MASTYRSINSDVSNLSSIVNTTMTAMPDAVPTTPTAMGLPVTEGTLLIPELLIAVIGFLPYRDNGKVRRVSKKLRDTIDDSLTIRQQRFLDADPKAGGRPIYIWTGGLPWSHHKIVGHPSGHFTPPESLGIFANRDPEQFVPRSVVKVHPLLPVSKGGRWIDRVGAHMTFPWDLKEMLAWEEGGTWEKAFLTQPPVQNITLWVVYIESETPSIETRKGWLFKMSDKDGLRFRHVVKELKATTFDEEDVTREVQLRSRTFEVRIQQRSRAKDPMERYKEVVATVDDVIVADSHWTQEAELHEMWTRKTVETDTELLWKTRETLLRGP